MEPKCTCTGIFSSSSSRMLGHCAVAACPGMGRMNSYVVCEIQLPESPFLLCSALTLPAAQRAADPQELNSWIPRWIDFY